MNRITSRPDFVDSEIVIRGLISVIDFYKRVRLLFKKRHVLDCQKKIYFVQIMYLKFTFLTFDNIRSYYYQSTNYKIVLFYLKLKAKKLATVNCITLKVIAKFIAIA